MIDISAYHMRLEAIKSRIPEMVERIAFRHHKFETKLFGEYSHYSRMWNQMKGRSLRLPPPIILSGWNKGEPVQPVSHTIYNKFDGCRLDELIISASLKSRHDCELLIETLQVHKWCFYDRL